ncbi:MAG TPA: hypothetical protein VHS99_16995 [Chloroflexota bacterium]|nr:hypothetical protein [Chloroflexota bacterium]
MMAPGNRGWLQRRGAERLTALLEVATGATICLLLGWLVFSGWRFYTVYLLPDARQVPTATATPVIDPTVVREQARRMRQVLDHVGAGIAFRQASQRERAIQEFRAALELDPTSVEARQNLVELGLLPTSALLSTPTPTPTVVITVTPIR